MVFVLQEAKGEDEQLMNLYQGHIETHKGVIYPLLGNAE